jgi:hypothetical protein
MRFFCGEYRENPHLNDFSRAGMTCLKRSTSCGEYRSRTDDLFHAMEAL